MAIWTPSCHETWLATGHCHFWGWTSPAPG
jgi:hypothetical protein